MCARGYSDEDLLRHGNQYGNFDISKVGCSEKVFWANLKEVRSVKDPPPLPQIDYRAYVDPFEAAVVGVLWMVIVVALGVLIIFVRRVAMWVIGA